MGGWIPRFRLSPFLANVSTTTLTTLAVSALSALQIGLLARGLDPADFGLYSISRRTLHVLAPISTLMMGIALPRFIASRSDDSEDATVRAGSLLAIGPGVLIFVLAIALRDRSGLIGDGAGARGVVIATGASVAANSIWVALYSFYRGTERNRAANVAHLWSLGVVPLTAGVLAIGGASVTSVLYVMAAGQLVLSVPLARHFLASGSRGFQARMTELVRFALPRVPGHIAFSALVALATLVAPFLLTVTAAGYLGLAGWVLSMLDAGLVGLAIVVLPAASRLLAAGNRQYVGERAWDVVSMLFQVGLFVSVQLAIWTDLLIVVLLGDGYAAAVGPLRVMIAALVPYAIYVGGRSFIDAFDERAVNARNAYVALAGGLVSAAIIRDAFGASGLALANVVGLLLLGILTVNYLWKNFGPERAPVFPFFCLTLNAVLGVAAIGVRASLAPVVDGYLLLLAALLIELVFVIGYVWMLERRNMRWIMQLRTRLIASDQQTP